jgi:hypothetical protein
MTAHELRRKNLVVLLEGKGAKSALARLISLSPASITSMVNGTKSLEKEFCATVAHGLGLPNNWFETERASGDVPEAVRKKLAPMTRGTAAPAPAKKAAKAAAKKAAAASDSTGDNSDGSDDELPEANVPAEPAAPAAAPVAMPKQWPDGTSKIGKVRHLTGTGAATASAAEPSTAPAPAPEVAATAAAPEVAATPPARATRSRAPAPHAAAPAPAASSPAAVVRELPASQAGDSLPVAVTGFVIEGGLPPIVEALIKTLAQKGRQGSLSEDRAFEILGNVRTL